MLNRVVNMVESTLEVILQHKKACCLLAVTKRTCAEKKRRGLRISLADISTGGESATAWCEW